jgi:hypothetical protein
MLELLKEVRESKQKPYVSMSSGGQYNVLDKDGKTAYSTKDKTLAYTYFKKNYDKLKEQDEKDHEVSMARGELEAIADKATQLASMLQGKSDEGNPLEAWVQSKITKAKDYITSVADYLTYNPDMKQNEELEESIMSNIATLKSEFQRLDTDYKKMKDEYNAIMAGSYKGDESAVEKKMFKALRSLKDVRQELTSALKTVKEEVEEIDEMEDYGLKGTITDKQLQNIKSVWAKKTKKDVTPGVKTMLAKLDTPTKIAIKQANINVLSDLVEEINEGYSSTLKAKAKEIAKKLAGNMTKAYDEIEKIAKGLSKDPEVQKALQMANEEVDRPKPSEPNPKELEEVISHTVRYTDPLNKKRFAIPYKTHADAEKKMAQLKKDGVKDINITMDALKPNIKFKEEFVYKNLSVFREKYLNKNNVEEGLMKDIFIMDKEGASADDIAKRLKINVSTVKNILGEQKEEMPIKKDNQKEIEAKNKEIEALKNQLSLMKQKIENEKNKAVKPVPNPETGEVPLTIGIAHKILRDNQEKKAEEKKQKEASKQIQSMAKGGEETKLEFFTKKYLSHLNESEASDKAKALGLTYMSFGRYGKDGQVTHKSVGGSLKALSKKDQETEKDTDKPSKPKTKTTGSIKNPDGSNTTSGSIKKEILKKIEDEDLTDPDMLHQFDDELSNLADDLRQTGDRETADKILDALDSVADGDISSDAPSKIEDMINALKGKPDFNTQYQKELGKMTNLYKDAKYSKQNIKDFIKDTDSIINKMSQVVEVGSQDSADYGMTVRSDAVTELAYTCTEIQDKLDEMDIDKDTKDSIYDELDTIASKNDEDNADEKEIVMAIERLKYEFKKLNKKKLKEENISEEKRLFVESIAAVKNKAEKTGMPYSILKQVYDRGMAAWKSGHRPGASQQQWAFARVNSFITKSSGTWGGADKDLAAKVKGEK